MKDKKTVTPPLTELSNSDSNLKNNKKSPLKKPHLLFDFDGTLVTTEEIAQEAIKNYFEQNSVPNQEYLAKLIIGRTWRAAAERIQEESRAQGILVPSTLEMIQGWKKEYQLRIQNGVTLIPGVKEQLEKLRTDAAFMGIVTGSDREEVEHILKQQGLEHFFERLWTSSDYSHSKPDPAPYLTAMSDLKITPNTVLAFEDSPAGIEAAHRAGLSWIQIAHGDYVVHDPRSIQIIPNWHHLDYDSILTVR